MADRKFQIEVATSFNPAGSQQATESLRGIGKATGQTAEKAEELNKHSREMHRLFGEIDRITPGLGESMKALFEPSAAGILAVIVALELLMKAFENVKKRQEEAAEEWGKQHEAAQEAAKSADDFARALERVHDAQAQVNTEFQTQKAVLDAQIEGHKKLLDLLEKEQLAAAGDDKQKQEAVKSRFDDLKREYDITAETDRLRKNQDIVGARRQKQSALDAAAKAAEDQLDAAQKNPEVAKLENLLIGGNTHAGAAESITKSVEKETEMQIRNIRFNAETNGQSKEEVAAAIERVKADAEKRLDQDPDVQAALSYDLAQKTLDAHRKTVEDLKARAGDTKQARDANSKAIDEGAAANQTAEAVLEQHKKDADRQAAFNIVDRAGGFSNADNIIAAGVGAESAVQGGKKIDQHMAEQIQAMHALFQTVGGNATLIIQILRQSLAAHKTNEQEIAQLKQQFANLKSASTRNSPTGQ